MHAEEPFFNFMTYTKKDTHGLVFDECREVHPFVVD